MEKMTRKKALETVFTVIFVGIILSFSLTFAVTAMLTPEESVSEHYFDGSEGSTGIFSGFDDACLKNKNFYSVINEYEYRVFNNIPNREVIGGDGEFLFNGDTNEHGYNYIDDYTGKIKLTPEQLDRFHRYIEMRSRAYENIGAKYALAVIPNAQTVYGEYMPEYIGRISDETMLGQISSYFEAEGFDKLIDLRGAMTEGKKYGQLYNNTENTVNAIGAYAAYSGIIGHVESVFGGEIAELSEDYFVLGTRITDGKTLAKRADLESIIRNKTIYLSDVNERIYTLVELFGGLETTYVKHEHKSSASDITVFVECTQEWDKIQLMPYFSSTFYRSSYKVSHNYDKSAVESFSPDMVVQVIREDELWSILNGEIISSYNDGLEHGQNPYQTMAATEVASARIGKGTYCVTGVVEAGAEVTLFGDGLETVNAAVVDGRFLAVINVEDESTATQICISVKSGDKSMSDVSYVLISKADKIYYEDSVFVGTNGMMYGNADSEYSVPDDAEIQRFTEKVVNYFADVRSKNDYLGVQIIFALLPEKSSVYSDGLSDALKNKLEARVSNRMILERALGSARVSVIDTIGVLKSRSESSKMYYQTSDRLTDTASYYLYRNIMLTVADRFYYAAPHALDSDRYALSRRSLGAGVFAEAIGFDSTELNESAVRIKVKGRYEYVSDGGSLDFAGAFSTVHENGDLPTAVIVRDGDCDKIVEMLADNFSTMYVLPKGVTEIPDGILESGVDYVIVLAPEQNIDIK